MGEGVYELRRCEQSLDYNQTPEYWFRRRAGTKLSFE
jgi:hypothetical protein